MIPEEKVLARTQEIFGLARELYGLDLSQVYIRFDLLGSAAGQAGAIDDLFFIRFNRDMMRRSAAAHVHNEAVPHEVAHIVCFKIPELGVGHDEGWANVCKSLGGVGTTMHDEDIVYGKGATFEYTTTAGVKLRVSQQIHARVQQGRTYSFRRGQGIICKGCHYSIVGVRGKTLVNPVVNPPADALAVTAWGTL